jgi:hypothetical protein
MPIVPTLMAVICHEASAFSTVIIPITADAGLPLDALGVYLASSGQITFYCIFAFMAPVFGFPL